MRENIKKAYGTNPILFVHLSAVVIGVSFGALFAVFQSVTGIELPELVRNANATGFCSGIALWLSRVTSQRCKTHMSDESKITYIALRFYSLVVKILAVGWGVMFISNLVKLCL